METKEFTVTDDLLASKGKRFLNLIIDLFIVYLITIGIGAVLNIIGKLTGSYSLSSWIVSLTLIENVFFGVVVLFFYYLIMEIYLSRTFGKYFTKTLVVKYNGTAPKVKSIVIRTLVRLIPIEAFSFLTGNSRGWHDTLSVTYVVNKHEFISKMKL
ncbi:putative RDD family membrane protein YckC [Flavobacterium sp. CG_9.10]|uniref:RDD family protein n=1 Tax=Flavobacterium sp. CG_9.10 TaxID=2787729 RepID=UPI0018CB7D6F|nr:RDD family protein [Flavobacterium sp. CG_9.10]MBG6110600.1 putative RDD family membrane protein YckC [Flavobacterium sp. CG_9.10]